jgi:hypothetical protein
MLKALRYALYREVPFAGNVLSGAQLTALSDFVLLLANVRFVSLMTLEENGDHVPSTVSALPSSTVK